MTSVPNIIEAVGGTGGWGALLWLAVRARLPGGRSVRASVVVTDQTAADQTAAIEKQTEAIDRQTRESRKVGEKLGTFGAQIAGLSGSPGQLGRKVDGLTVAIGGVGKRVVRLEAQHEANGHGHRA